MGTWFAAHVKKIQAILDQPFGRQDLRTWRATWEQDEEMVAARLVRKDTGEPLVIHIHQLHITPFGGELMGTSTREISAAEIAAFLGLGTVDPETVTWEETGYRGQLATFHGETSILPAGPANGPDGPTRRH